MNHKKENFTIQVDFTGLHGFELYLEKNVSWYTVLTSYCKSVTLFPQLTHKIF